MFQLILQEPVSIVRMYSFFQHITLFPYGTDPFVVIPKKCRKVARGKVISFFKYIDHKKATPAYPGKLQNGFPFPVPVIIIHVTNTYLLPFPQFFGSCYILKHTTNQKLTGPGNRNGCLPGSIPPGSRFARRKGLM